MAAAMRIQQNVGQTKKKQRRTPFFGAKSL
jgi:hypothetical protein